MDVLTATKASCSALIILQGTAQPFALTYVGLARTLPESRKISKPIPLQIRPVYFESLPRFKCRIWGHRTRSAASGRVSAFYLPTTQPVKICLPSDSGNSTNSLILLATPNKPKKS